MKALNKIIALAICLSMILPTVTINANTKDNVDDGNTTEEIVLRTGKYIILDDMTLIQVEEDNSNVCLLMAHDCDERITLGSYTLTKQQTKDMADAMSASTGFWANIVYGILGVANPVVGVAAALSASAAFRNDVVYAGGKGYRIQITITDSKYCHTSYSTLNIYKVIT